MEDAVAPPNDDNIRDMITKETLRVLGNEREHEMASDETRSDHTYIEWIGHIFGGQHRHVARLIALVARYAGELPHDLIHPTARHTLQEQVDDRDTQAEQLTRVETLLGNHTWEEYIDPGLAGNARIACYDIGQVLPRLRGMNMTQVMATMALPDEHYRVFTDYFCAVVASRWRANSVLAAQPYKTKNEQAAVMLALHESSKRLCDFTLNGDLVKYAPRPHPSTLSELLTGHF